MGVVNAAVAMLCAAARGPDNPAALPLLAKVMRKTGSQVFAARSKT